MFGEFHENCYSTKEFMKDMGYFAKPQRNRPDLMPPNSQARNEKCACGSGKKYKKCCGDRKL